MKYIKKIKRFLLPALLLSMSSTANAYEWVIQGGIKSGGETIITLTDVNNKSASVSAGRGLALGFGINYKLTSDYKLRALIGASSGNGFSATEKPTLKTAEYKWSHTPLDFLVYSESDKWAYGAGLTLHLNPEFKTSGFATEKGVKYNTALGIIGQLDYRFTKHFFMGLNYTLINYKGDDGKTVNGTGFGFDLGYSFGE